MEKGALITFEEAMKCSRGESYDCFSHYVNPAEAGLLKMADMDRRYTKASGIFLYDDSGREYMDFTAGYGSLNLGHNPPEVLKAVDEARVLPAVMLAGFNPLMGSLAKNLSKLLPGGLSVTSFGSGGAEAVETAMKTALASTRRRKFVSCTNAYHGLSLGAISLCMTKRNAEVLGAKACDAQSVPFGDLESLEQKLKPKDVAGFIVEPVQGEGGAVVPPKGYLKGAEELCRKYETLLILDEIQTGFGRTGKLFAMEHEHVQPDIVTLSKSLGAGVVPISASVTTPELWKSAFGSRDKFDLVVNTFGGHPAACAAALKSIEIVLRDKLPERAAELGDHAMKRLQEMKDKHKSVREVRGQGLFLGVALNTPKLPGANMDENLSAMMITRLLDKHGILTSYYDRDPTIIRIEPPLTVTKEQLDRALDAFDEVLGKGLVGLGLGFAKKMIGRAVGT